MNLGNLLVLAAFGSLVACGGGTASRTASSPPPATFADQVKLGGTLYGEECASCHGKGGEGGGAPRVVDLAKGALPLDPPAGSTLRKTQFTTVADVADFVVEKMPPGKGRSLTPEQYFAILAFDLHANGIDLETKLDTNVAKTLTIPR